MHRVQPDIGILSGLKLGVMQYSVVDHAAGVRNPVGIIDQYLPSCSSVPGAVVDRFWLELFD